MRMLKINAGSMNDALKEARHQLGDEAVVLHTRQYDKPGLFGLCKRQCVEILAATKDHDAVIPSRVAVDIDKGSDQMVRISRQVADMHHAVKKLADGLDDVSRRKASALSIRLEKHGVPEHIAQILLLNCDDQPERMMSLMREHMRCVSHTGHGGEQTRIALVGPTGVGKTTTAAKLAARYSILHKKSVAMITLDTYRIGAVDQLSIYAKILKLPFEVALSPEDADALVRKHNDKDVIIIDTVGRSQRDAKSLSELGQTLRAANPTEVHLVISASSLPSAQKESVESFCRIGADRLLITKLDECPHPGFLLDLALSTLLPFSYITHGQVVPDDISSATSKLLAQIIWDGSV